MEFVGVIELGWITYCSDDLQIRCLSYISLLLNNGHKLGICLFYCINLVVTDLDFVRSSSILISEDLTL